MPKLYEIEGGAASVSKTELGILATNVYFVDDGEGGVVVVDPADHPDAILQALDGRPVSAILLTHGHYDHVGACAALREATGAPVIANAAEEDRINNPREGYAGRMAPPCEVDRTVVDGDVLQFGKTSWQVMHTPGHTEGSTCYFLDPAQGTNPAGRPMLLAGDTLFYGSHGRTDLPGGNYDEMLASLARLGTLPGDTLVMPGHNALTTIAGENERTIGPLTS